jgi:hypothetical protein
MLSQFFDVLHAHINNRSQKGLWNPKKINHMKIKTTCTLSPEGAWCSASLTSPDAKEKIISAHVKIESDDDINKRNDTRKIN